MNSSERESLVNQLQDLEEQSLLNNYADLILSVSSKDAAEAIAAQMLETVKAAYAQGVDDGVEMAKKSFSNVILSATEMPSNGVAH